MLCLVAIEKAKNLKLTFLAFEQLSDPDKFSENILLWGGSRRGC
jgi:hypothetical protein